MVPRQRREGPRPNSHAGIRSVCAGSEEPCRWERRSWEVPGLLAKEQEVLAYNFQILHGYKKPFLFLNGRVGMFDNLLDG